MSERKRYDILIVGAGESGIGAAILAKTHGLSCFLTDSGKVPEKYLQELAEIHVACEENGHTEDLLNSCSEIVKSPGVPENSEFIRSARNKGINIISEIEFGSRYYNGKIVAITGSNGKTTTASLLYHILKKSGENVCLAGNIGWSFCRIIADSYCSSIVLEISSFQLDDIHKFKPDVAILLNITPDHLDRYDNNMNLYAASKFNIVKNQTTDDAFIYYEDDANISKHLEKQKVKSKHIGFTEDTIASKLDTSKLKLKGRHNIQNLTAAFLAAKTFDIPEEKILQEIYEFQPMRHRLQTVSVINGVEYINDSKATNVDAVKYALESFEGPIIWIAGGVDKGNDYSILNDSIKNVKALICIGNDTQKLVDYYKEKINNITTAASLKEAIKQSHEMAANGDIVLLSPACASFDWFKNYEDRGNQFITSVKDLKD